MKSVKDKLYNYEVTPPPESWQIIVKALNQPDPMHLQFVKHRNKAFKLSLAAAFIIIIALSLIIRINDQRINKRFGKNFMENNTLSSDDKITVPQTNEDSAANQKSILANAAETSTKKYITITGPDGQPVQISSKVTSLIVYSDDQNPPNLVWNDKVKKWKNIMEANFLAPTTVNFLDIVDFTHALK